MKNWILYVFLLIPLISKSQSTLNLDEKNGYKEFKFGTSPTYYQNLEKNKNQYSKNPDIESYYYIGTEHTNIANVDITSIQLDFYKGKLFDISIGLGEIGADYTIPQYNLVLYALEQTYGKDWNNPTNSDGIIQNGAIWMGKKVTLESFRIDFSKSKTNPEDFLFIGGYIHIYDQELMKQFYQSDF